MPNLPRRAAVFGASALAGLAPSATAWGQERVLRIGLSGAISSMDPHFTVLSSNQSLSEHFFEALVSQDAGMQAQPGLALSWAAVEPLVWEFKLRPDVRFTDGSPFGGEDVAASLERAPKVPNSPSSFSTYTSSIRRVETVDPLTVRIHTSRPDPLLPSELAAVMIIPRTQRDAATADFNSGRAMIGTGPFRFVDYVPGSRVTMTRNDDYWGGAQPWSKVVMSIIPNNASRTAGLLSGDLDVIDNVGPADMPSIRTSSRVQVSAVTSIRVIFLMVDQGNAVSPDVRGADGRPLDRNPLKDRRVRQALSLAINRQAICERLMAGQAVPAGQILSGNFLGVSPRITVPNFDVAKARQLLADAGYPNGFKLTLRGPNDRYLNDASVLQAVAQMLTRAGVDAAVEVAPWVAFRPLIGASTFSVALFGWASNTGETGNSLNALLGTQDASMGRGVPNGGRYSNQAFDALIAKAGETLDRSERGRLLNQAIEMSMDDVALIPLFFPVSSWASRTGIDFTPAVDEYTRAMQARPA